MKEVRFDPSGGSLWIQINMTGIYFIPYIYQLWGSNKDPQAILTIPPKVNSNEVDNDDFYRVINDLSTAESLSNFHSRVIEVSFDVHKLSDDPGYILTVIVLQGNNPGNLVELERDTKNDKIVSGSVKNERILIRLIDQTI